MKTIQKIDWSTFGDTKYSRAHTVGIVGGFLGDIDDRYHIWPQRDADRPAGPYRCHRLSYNGDYIGDYATREAAIAAAKAHHEQD